MRDIRIALLSANIGSFDPVFPIKTQGYACDVHYYTEKNLPYPLPNLNDRLKSKYIKIKTHRFLPNYDAYVWIDGSVEIVSHKFVERMIVALEDSDIVIAMHPERANVYEEIDYILSNIEAGKEYLIKRYAGEPFPEELVFYKNDHSVEPNPLYATRFFARWNNKRLNRCFDDWWDGCLEFTNFDQTMFSYVSAKHGLKIMELEYKNVIDGLINVHKH